MTSAPDPGPGTGSAEPRRRFVDPAPLLHSPAFARLWVGGFISGIGSWLTVVAVSLLLFDITHQPIYGALVGGIALLPAIVAGLWGGMLIDAFDRRTVMIASSLIGWGATIAVLALALADAALQAQGERVAVWPFYIFTTLSSVAQSVTVAGRQAAVPRLLPPELVSRAAALNGISIGLQLTIGPALAGVLVAAFGFPAAFAVDIVLFSAIFL